ncbi:putative Ig domain-containing protein [Paenibacillus sp. 598K]|uniref:carbohydrate-binding protein n=1 Tax=Paenibacillus sp. 598K TaxID=1117987 RepID=UPI000FFA0126|nr:carbohydrate-binding protein [Paenibacillus sp. 598K]GBF71896.1 putative Ig domain-containing protein [Paenibacillus sp. 598K]
MNNKNKLKTLLRKSTWMLCALTVLSVMVSLVAPSIIVLTVKASSPGTELYVSSSAAGAEEGTLAAPFHSLAAARDAVRLLIADGMDEDITVYVRGGEYPLSSMLVFDERDSGRDGHTITYRSYPGETPTIIGGAPLSGWESVGGGIYSAEVGSLRFQTLYENGERAVKARYPDKGEPREGYLTVAEEAETEPAQQFRFAAGDLPTLTTTAGLELFIWPGDGISWTSDTLRVQSINYTTRTVALQSPATYPLGPGARYYIQGALELLDQPGEFYLDDAQGKVYYKPKALPIDDQLIVAPAMSRLIAFKGGSQTTPVEHIRWIGMTLQDSDFAPNAQDGLIYMENARSIEVSDNVIRNGGIHAMYLFGWNQQHTISGNLIYNIGHTGVQIQSASSWASHPYISKQNTVTNNHIRDVGQLVGHGAGIQLVGSGDNTVSHNLIHEAPRYAISLKGMTPGNIIGKTIDGIVVTAANAKEFANSKNNIIEYNEVYNVNTDSQDTGMIEAWGAGLGNVIRYNRLHHSGIHFSFGFGIYLDDHSDDFIIAYNVIDHLQVEGDGELYSPIRVKGTSNRIIGNVVADNPNAKRGVIGLSGNYGDSPAAGGAAQYKGNILYNNGNTLYTFNDWTPTRLAGSDDNLFYNASGQYNVTGVTGVSYLEQWLAYEHGRYDAASQVAAPLFMNPAQADYRLSYLSPAYTLGWQDIDYASIGLTDTFRYAETSDPLDRLYIATADHRSYASMPASGTTALQLLGRTETGYVADLTDADISFASDDTAVATVDASGVVTGVSNGVARITATVELDGRIVSAAFDVLVDDELSAIGLTSGRTVLEIDEQASLRTIASTLHGARQVLNNGDVSFVSDAPGIATVDSAGVVEAQAAGSATITATYTAGGQTYTAQMPISVRASRLGSVQLTAQPVLTEGDTAAYTLSGQMTDGTAADLSSATLAASATPGGVVSVDTTAGEVTAVAEGRARISIAVTLDGVALTAVGETVVFPATTPAVPSPWQVTTFGTAQGYAQWSGGEPTKLISSGDNIWGASDSFSYAYRDAEPTGDESSVSIGAKLHSLVETDKDAAAGLMFRDGTSASANNVNLRVIPGGGLRLTYRNADHPGTSFIMGPTVSLPVEIKLTKEADTYIGYYKRGGVWTEVGRATMESTHPLTAGLAVFSHDSLPTEAVFSQVALQEAPLQWSSLRLTAPTERLWASGQTTSLTAEGVTAAGTTIDIPLSSVAFNSSDTSVATVDATGTVTSTGYGTAVISASATIQGTTVTGSLTIQVIQPRQAYATIQAESADVVQGLTKYTTIIGGTTPSSWASYKDVDFGASGPAQFELRVAVPLEYAGKTVQVRLDSQTGPTIATMTIQSTGGWSTMQTQSASMNGDVTGVHDVYLYFANGGAGNIDWFRFYEEADTTALTSAIAEAETLLGTAVVGTAPGQYPPSAAAALQTAIETAEDAAATQLTQQQANAATSELQSAMATFRAAIIVPVRDPYSSIQAESADEVHGLTKYSTIIGGTTPSSWARYRRLDFGASGPDRFEVRVAVPAQYAGKTIEVRLDSPTGTTIGSLVVASTGDWGTMTVQGVDLTLPTGISGEHDVYLYFANGGAGNIDWFRFYEADQP